MKRSTEDPSQFRGEAECTLVLRIPFLRNVHIKAHLKWKGLLLKRKGSRIMRFWSIETTTGPL